VIEFNDLVLFWRLTDVVIMITGSRAVWKKKKVWHTMRKSNDSNISSCLTPHYNTIVMLSIQTYFRFKYL